MLVSCAGVYGRRPAATSTAVNRPTCTGVLKRDVQSWET